jgi:hypothetical protein
MAGSASRLSWATLMIPGGFGRSRRLAPQDDGRLSNHAAWSSARTSALSGGEMGIDEGTPLAREKASRINTRGRVDVPPPLEDNLVRMDRCGRPRAQRGSAWPQDLVHPAPQMALWARPMWPPGVGSRDGCAPTTGLLGSVRGSVGRCAERNAIVAAGDRALRLTRSHRELHRRFPENRGWRDVSAGR